MTRAIHAVVTHDHMLQRITTNPKHQIPYVFATYTHTS